MENTEVWKDVVGYEDIYEVSNIGRVRSKGGKITSHSRGGKRVWPSKIMKIHGSAKSGLRISLWKDGKKRDWLVHRIVAFAFLGEPEEGMTVNHKDGDRLNNDVENLEWLSRADNLRHAFATGLMTTTKPITLINGGNSFSFNSLSEATRFLGRGHYYIPSALKYGRGIKSKDGTVYTVRFLDKGGETVAVGAGYESPVNIADDDLPFP